MPCTKEEATRLGIKIQPIKHSKKRRAIWHDYTRRGMYLLSIHICTDEEGLCYEGMLLSHIVGEPMAEAGSEVYPHPELTDLGRMVDYKIDAISSYPQFKDVEVKARTIMPTHIHLILEVKHDLPYYAKRHRPYHLGDLVRGFKQGCTSLFKRWMRGESVEAILDSLPSVDGGGQSVEGAQPRTYTTPPGGQTDISLWERMYNDRVLIGDKAIQAAHEYVAKNAWYWQMETLYPQLFQHALHLTIAGCDYSAYGCLFLLKHPERRQVFCHRLARRSQLTDEEWQKATSSWDAIRAFEKHAREHKLGHFDKDWYRNNNPSCTTAIDYTHTEAFQREKTEHLRACEEMGAVLVSPAVSPGEAAICYAALEMGLPVIKLQKDAITAREHPAERDRSYCGKGIMLVLGPWEIKGGETQPSTAGKSESTNEKDGVQNGKSEGTNEKDGSLAGKSEGIDEKGGSTTGKSESADEKGGNQTGERAIPKDSLYGKFHNLNAMAAELCKDSINMSIDKNTLMACSK